VQQNRRKLPPTRADARRRLADTRTKKHTEITRHPTKTVDSRGPRRTQESDRPECEAMVLEGGPGLKIPLKLTAEHSQFFRRKLA
jgi:hypothetical protein